MIKLCKTQKSFTGNTAAAIARLSLMLLLFFTSAITASAFVVDGATYTVNNSTNLTVTLSKWTDAKGDIKIPTTVVNNNKTYTVNKIGERAFADNTQITSVTSEKIEQIYNAAFNNCKALKKVAVGNTLKYIGNSVFRRCALLEYVNIPDVVESIGDYAFSECPRLFIGDGSGTALKLPATLKSLGKEAFSQCALSELTFASSSPLTFIPEMAFHSCDNLRSVTLPSNITKIGSSAFGSCSKLGGESDTELIIPKSVTTIENNAFSACQSLVSVTLHEGLTTIGSQAFLNCSSLAKIEFPASLTSLGSYAFLDCSSLMSVKFKEGIKVIGSGAFRECTSLPTIDFPASLLKICAYGFYKCSSLKSTTRAKGQKIDESEDCVFSECSKFIKHLERDDNHKTLSVVKKSPKESSVANSVEEETYVFNVVGRNGYYNCKNMTEPLSGIISYGENAFKGCTSLAVLPGCDNMTAIPSYAFEKCEGLTEIVIPGNIHSIGQYAFFECKNVRTLTLSNGLRTIGGRAFRATSITHVDLPASLRTIGDDAFYSTYLSGSLLIPDFVEYIGTYAFYTKSSGDNKLVRVQLGTSALLESDEATSTEPGEDPKPCLTIGKRAFYGTDVREVVSYHIVPPALPAEDDVFYSRCLTEGTLYVPEGTVEAYRTADGWSKFVNIKEISSSGISLPGEDVVTIDIDPDGTVMLQGVAPNLHVNVYNSAGHEVYSGRGEASIYSLSPGVYILVVGSRSIKFRV